MISSLNFYERLQKDIEEKFVQSQMKDKGA